MSQPHGTWCKIKNGKTRDGCDRLSKHRLRVISRVGGEWADLREEEM
jgi:hypothetical protein